MEHEKNIIVGVVYIKRQIQMPTRLTACSSIVWFLHGLYPLVTKPTRVTSSSFTCIDNSFTNVLDKPITPFYMIILLHIL